VETAGTALGAASAGLTVAAVGSCFALRWLSLRFGWNLPRFGRPPGRDGVDSRVE
jgi:uncharacterized membrane protein YeiH